MSGGTEMLTYVTRLLETGLSRRPIATNWLIYGSLSGEGSLRHCHISITKSKHSLGLEKNQKPSHVSVSERGRSHPSRYILVHNLTNIFVLLLGLAELSQQTVLNKLSRRTDKDDDRRNYNLKTVSAL